MTNLENLTRYYVDIIEITNKNCTRHEIEALDRRFAYIIHTLHFTLPRTNFTFIPQVPEPPLRKKYDSPLTLKETRQLFTTFDLLVECKIVDETNKTFDDTEDFEYYIGTYTNKDRAINKSLVIKAVIIDIRTEKPICSARRYK